MVSSLSSLFNIKLTIYTLVLRILPLPLMQLTNLLVLRYVPNNTLKNLNTYEV